MDYPRKVLGARIRALREQQHMNQEDLGTAVGLSKSQISRYESGASEPPLDVIMQLGAALGLHWTELMAPQAAGEESVEYTSAPRLGLRGSPRPTAQEEHGTVNKEIDWESLARELLDIMKQDKITARKRIDEVEAPDAEARRLLADAQREAAVASRITSEAQKLAQTNMQSLIEEMKFTHHAASRPDEESAADPRA